MIAHSVSNWNILPELTQVTRSLRSVWRLPDFRLMVMVAAGVFLFIAGADIVSGMLKHQGVLSADHARFFRISEEGSLGELSGQVVMQMSIIFIFLAGFEANSPLHMFLAGLLQYAMLDDILGWHESAGAMIGRHFYQWQTALKPSDLGELSFGVLFCALAAAFLIRIARKASPHHMALSALLLLPIGFVAFCAVGLDFVHALISTDTKMLNGLMALAEDGGEFLGMLILMLLAMAQWTVVTAHSTHAERFTTSP